jgi:DNA-3-methyladenine glycosylase
MRCVPRLTREFFQRPALVVSRELLGQRLVRLEDGGMRLSGRIVETEAYVGTEDQACHARSGRSARNATMWGPAGYAYVYFTYGMHWMLNLVTGEEGHPEAVLLRGIRPEEGIRVMRERRSVEDDRNLANGPGKICQAFAIDGAMDGLDVCAAGSILFLEAGIPIPDEHVTNTPRVGINNVSEPWKSIPWRFVIPPGAIQTAEEDS